MLFMLKPAYIKKKQKFWFGFSYHEKKIVHRSVNWVG